MKSNISHPHKKRQTIARHRILVFKEEIRMIPAPRRIFNPLFLQAHDYETLRTLPVQSN